ncbi:MAG: SUMF1/EgtB/PvdO family nonheme iron enzyme, partial [Lentisphaerae bacterium]|nr:SUMF1/EgtB/PvdO family nonheme iron enzyme [Lentisphaerota bacterium]
MATRHLSVLLCLTSALLPTPLVASSARGFRVVEVRDRAGHELGRFGSSLALVIHVSRYQDASWGDLPSAALEAETISSALSDNGFAVTRLENPTSDDLSRGLNGLVGASVADKTGRMVIFFAGHGHQRDGPFGGRKKGYLVPADAPHPDKGLEGFTAKALEMSDLVALCSKLECSHALFVLDCPFSSTVLASRGVGVRKADIPAYISERVLLPVRQFIAVTAEQERTRNRESFAEAFVLALDGAADRDDDGYVLGTELGHYFEAELSSWRKGQSAEFGKMRHPLWDRGDFCFVVPRTGLAGSEYQALQRFLRDHGHYKGTIDGLPGTETWRALQALLRQRGYYRGEPDGVPGSLTREALKVLQARIRIAQTGRLDSATVEAIGAGRVPQIQTSVPPLSPEQGTGTEVALPEAVTPGEDTKVSGLDLELAWIAPGTFRMGALDGNSDERPVHPVRIPQGFWMGRCEITNQQYQTFVAEAAYDGLEDADGDYLKHLDEGNALSHGGRLPVVWVNWNNCVAFCDWLTSHEQEAGRLPAGYVFRLPTEAEWEYAARAGTATPYSFGNDPSQLSRYGNFCDRSSKLRWRDLVGDDGYSEAAPVGSLRHNGWGMHDMHGNVWEWCLDRYDGRFYSRSPIENPSGPVAGDSRVARGGSWRNNSTQCRSSMRISVLLPSTRPVLGFRVVLAPPV